MSRLIDIIQNEEHVLSLIGAKPYEVEAAENRLGLRFSQEYKEYTMKYGAVSINDKEYTGVVADPNLDVVDNTLFARRITPQAQPDWYVILDMHIDGIIIWQDLGGAIYQTMPGDASRKICDSMATYLSL